MWDFLQWIIITFFIVSLILTKVTSDYSEEYNIIRRVFIISAVIFGILVTLYTVCFIMDILIARMFESIIEVFYNFFSWTWILK